MQAVKQTSVEVSENGEEEEEEAEFGEEDLFHQQVEHAETDVTPSGVSGSKCHGPASDNCAHPQCGDTTGLSGHMSDPSARTPSPQGFGWGDRGSSPESGLRGPSTGLGAGRLTASFTPCRGTRGLPRGVAG